MRSLISGGQAGADARSAEAVHRVRMRNKIKGSALKSQLEIRRKTANNALTGISQVKKRLH
jgi:hypothetical protein